MKSRIHLCAATAIAIAVPASVTPITAAADSISAQAADSVPARQLQEIVVEGTAQYVTAEGMVFMPGEKIRKKASNGFSLLDMMSVPGISVDRVAGTAKTPANDDIDFFIDYLPANDSQMRGLRPEDVRRVEVLDYPADPRFKGKAHVVNFILVKYEYGGYVQAGGMQGLRTSWGLYNLYSKTSYKSMTYDVLLGASYHNPMHSSHTDTESTYRFPGTEVVRKETSRNLKSVEPAYWVSARAIYENEQVSMANTLGYTGSRSKNNETGYTDSFSSPLYPSGESVSRVSGRSNSVEWTGDWSFQLPWSLWLVASPSATYTRSHNDRTFAADDTEITNNVPETAWQAAIDATLQRQFGPHSLSIQLGGNLSNNYMDYIGSNPTHIVSRQGDFKGKLKGALRFGRLNIDATAGLYSSRHSVNSVAEIRTTMDADLSANYKFDRRNSLRLTYGLSYTNPSQAARNPNLVFSDMIDAVQGNPDLHRYSRNRVNLDYTLLLTNDLWISLSAGYTHYADPIVATYTPLLAADRYIMVRSSQNMGHFAMASYGGSVTYKLFDKSLTLTGSVYGRDEWREYYGSKHLSYPSVSLRAQYYLKDFSLSAWWRSGKRGMGWTNTSRSKQQYGVNAGYEKSGFEASVSASNFFGKSRKYSTSYISTPYLDQHITYYSLSGVCTFQVSLSYSFSYGKKVNQWDRVGQASAVESGANL